MWKTLEDLLEFIAVGEVVSIEGSYSSLYILVIYVCNRTF